MSSNSSVIHAYILPTSLLLDLDIGHISLNLIQYITHTVSLYASVITFQNSHLQLHSCFHSEHPVVLTLYIYIVIYLYSPYSSLLNPKKV